MITSIAVKASVCCPKCSTQAPLNGIHARVRCPACKTVIAVEGELVWWRDQEFLDDGVAHAVTAAEAEELPFETDDVRLAFIRKDPACPGCALPIPAADVAAAVGRDACACASCGASLLVRPADPARHDTMPWLRGLAAEASEALVEKRAGAEQAVTVTCPGCGAELAPAAGTRTARCAYCGTTSLMPDPDAPQRRREWFYLIIDADERTTTRWSFLKLEREDTPALGRIARDPSTPPAHLEMLAEIDWVVLEVSSNPSTPESVLARLASHEKYNVRVRVAKNPRTPPAMLAKLASDKDHDVREAVARLHARPSELQLQLARDPDSHVRIALAEQDDATEEVLSILAADPENHVQLAVLGRPSLAPAVESVLAASKLAQVREAVAKNERTSAVTFAKLARDPEWAVRYHVAANTACPAELLAQLAWHGDPEDSVTVAARNNPACPKKPWWKIL